MIASSKLLEVLADQAAELDEIAEDRADAYNARVREVLGDLTVRDADVFALFDADIDLLVPNFVAVPRGNRDADWRSRLAALIAAARAQSYAETVLRPALEAAEEHGAKSEPIAALMSERELRQAAKEGISKDAVDQAARARKAARAEALAASGEELG